MNGGTDIWISDRLTPRQREIHELVTKGHTSRQISTILGISRRTVEDHRRIINTKRRSEQVRDERTVSESWIFHPTTPGLLVVLKNAGRRVILIRTLEPSNVRQDVVVTVRAITSAGVDVEGTS